MTKVIPRRNNVKEIDTYGGLDLSSNNINTGNQKLEGWHLIKYPNKNL